MTARPVRSPRAAGAPAAVAAAVAVLSTLGALACSKGPESTGRCQTDDACGDGRACASGTCLPRAAPPASWGVALTPRSDSTAGYTELPGLPMAAASLDLVATPKVTITGALGYDANATPVTTAHVVLTVPSTIAGLSDLQYETDLATASKTPTPTFTLPVPSGLVGRAGKLRVLPGAPDNATHAPATFAVMVAPMLALPIPTKALTVSGRLLSALGDPLVGLVARAFEDGDLVSNVASTTADGFSLLVPADTSAPSLAVELAAAASDAPQPHFWAKPFALTASYDLGDVQLPAYGQPNTFSFLFQGRSPGDPAVTGALVRAHTVLADDARGTTDYLRDGQTDMTGQASLSLLPGSTDALRLYDVAVVPPAGSVYATRCLEMFGLAAGGLQPAVTLDRRPVFTGSVVGADGTPVADATIQATRTAPEQATACDEYASPPVVTGTTMDDGSFQLLLDAGTYTLDFDPPAGAPYPRLTETGVAVSTSSGPHAVQLPPGAVLEGTLRDGAGAPLPQAGLRFYQPRPACPEPTACAGTAAVLEAQARADGNGHYRVVIPTP
ncbi:MAG TPA: carboxypeptidase-like regulatory domain-containing protein [Polyangia bacterium]|nr:carboxypeptidase-like regulatory domain-containing protein [Polyangia bacterium]